MHSVDLICAYTYASDYKSDHVVCSSAGVHASREKTADSCGCESFATTMSYWDVSDINSASSDYLLSFLETVRDTHEWVHARQLIVNMQVSGLLTPQGKMILRDA
jgi:hypothetical protein